MNDTTAAAAGAPPTPLARARAWWRAHIGEAVDQAEVTERRREDGRLSEHYLFMTAMSGAIAILGLLLSSPAVVIGAMLISPLMGPIIGLGFALAIGDWAWVRDSLRTLAIGAALAVLLSAALVFVSPIQAVTPEIAARTRPNLFDLFVALFSALAGAYAMIRGREGAIVGVAIATALMPPLAVVGYGLATWNGTVFSGALLLFVTNFITIAFTAFGMARLYGFRARLSRRQSRWQSIMVVVVLMALAVPLGFTLQRIAWEANAQRIVRAEIRALADERAQLDALEIDFAAEPVTVHAVLFTPVLRPEINGAVERVLGERLGEPVKLDLVQYQVGTSATDAERAQLASARERDERSAARRLDALALRLALAAGVTPNEVLIDEGRRRALVRARRLEGAELATYRALEGRITASEPEWRIELVPPPAALVGSATIPGGPEGEAALATIAWAAQRLERGVVLTGPAAEAEAAAAVLRESDVTAETRPGPAPLRASWVSEAE
ncbi:TIGR00341 family protein [Erythrobacter sp. WG]|uniref:TIGR00341 family protein n=1 Tax=Erythrobacter sp. WG TaxID=2985510 RepID=UPI00226F443F|nr:TIGR00341 family protein [Erythrobacter sp. WG]MCX9148395.1 TIGR00341 family protein [Erythrobacter sp. WG]